MDGAAIGVDGAHEHGVVRMGLAVDGLRLSLDMEAPASAVFGFEHAPTTDEERAAVAEALIRVRSDVGGVIAVPPELSCRIEDVEVIEAPDVGQHDDDHAEDGHDVDGADQDHDEDHAEHVDEEGLDHDHADRDDHAHSEVRIAVVWMCAESPERNAATLRLNELWSEVTLVDLTVITSEGQAAGRVASDAAFRF